MSKPRIGFHLSTAGGVFNAAERANQIGANTFQIFSSSPRMWRPARLEETHCERMRELRKKYDCWPLVIHTSYLVNLCSQSEEVRAKSSRSLSRRGRARPGSGSRISGAASGLMARSHPRRRSSPRSRIDCEIHQWRSRRRSADFQILIENTAGAEFSLGGSFEQVAELIHRLRNIAPVGACLDSCHTHVAGYDIVSEDGYAETTRQIEATIGAKAVRVWHTNDAKAPRGSKLDRHEQIGRGTIGLEAFRRLLNDKRFAHCAFIAEVPVEQPDDDQKNVALLKSLVIPASPNRAIRRQSVK